jgi:hypothetical protein
VFNEPYDQDMDLFVWGRYYGISGGLRVGLTTDVTLPSLDAQRPVLVQALVKSRRTNATNYMNTLQLYVNNVAVAKKSFSGSQVQIVNLNVPANYFVAGLNRIKLEPTGENLLAGEYDMVYIDTIDITYFQHWFATNDQILLMNNQVDTDLAVDGFSTQALKIYDLSLLGSPVEWINAGTFATAYGFAVQFNTPAESQQGRRIWISTENELLETSSLQLNYGSDLSNPANEADVIYVGTEELLEAVQPLASHREQQGFKTKLVTLESVYNEFGQGVVTIEAIREFFAYAHAHWVVKPKYYILLGDGTYDPKGHQNDVIKNSFPVKLIQGMAFNYGSDNWFVTTQEQTEPYAVIGRIPARSSAEMTNYVQKVLRYEAGTAKPQSSRLTVLVDKPLYQGENFEALTEELMQGAQIWNAHMPLVKVRRSQVTDGDFKIHINESFENSSLIHYMGHGAENMWADANVFSNNDIELLQNTHLPVVTAMNCLNALYYDPTLESFAEKLVMKKDGGAIAFWGSTSMTPPSVQSVYQKAFYEQLLTNPAGSMGDSVKLSKLQANQQSPFAEVMMSWTIIGDPMVKPVVAQAPVAQVTTSPRSGGNSGGCSLNAAYGTESDGTPWDLFFALCLESLIAWILIKTLHKKTRPT